MKLWHLLAMLCLALVLWFLIYTAMAFVALHFIHKFW